MVKLLLCGDDAEQVDDESKQQYGDKDEYHCAEVVCFSSFVCKYFAIAMCSFKYAKDFLGSSVWQAVVP